MTHPLKAWRIKRSLSQPEAGEKLGVDAMTVSRWERGEHLPHKKHWQTIEDTTGIPASALIGHVKHETVSQ